MRFPPVLLAYLIPIALGTIATAAFGAWVSFRPDLQVEQRLPGQDGFVASAVEAPSIDLKGTFTAGNATVQELPGSWPRFRGPDGSAISTEAVPLTRAFASQHLPALWSLEVGDMFGARQDRRARLESCTCLYLVSQNEACCDSKLRDDEAGKEGNVVSGQYNQFFY